MSTFSPATVLPTRNRGKRPARPTRRLFILDIENYAERKVLRTFDVENVRDSVYRKFAPTNEDLIVIGTSHTANFVCAGQEWIGPRHVMRFGHNGADLALLDAIGDYRLDTFGEVLILSGDGIFVNTAKALVARGIKVTVVSKFTNLNRALLWAAPCMSAA